MEALQTYEDPPVAEERLCELCLLQPKKYKCPGCGMFTCSLDCCKSHKQKTGCTGQRDRTKYVPIKEYKEKSLRSDYHFLEDVLQTKDRAKRVYDVDCLGKKGTKKQTFNRNKRKTADLEMFNTNTYQNLENYPKAVKTLFNCAKERRTKIIFQPPGMSRRQDNTSHVNTSTNLIHWKITCIFVIPNDISMSDLNTFDINMIGKETITSLASTLIGHNLNNLEESLTLLQVLEKAIETMPNGSSLKQIIRAWSQPIDIVRCLIKWIPSPANNPLFKEVLLTTTIKEMLGDHTVIEFPTIYFVHTPAMTSFRLLIAGVNDPVVETVQSNGPSNNNKRTRKQQQKQQQQENKRRKLALTAVVDAALTTENEVAEKIVIEEVVEDGELITADDDLIADEVADDGAIEEIVDVEGENKIEEEDNDDNNEDGEDEEEEVECDDFMKQLTDLQDLDAEQLRRIIQAEEAKELAHKASSI